VISDGLEVDEIDRLEGDGVARRRKSAVLRLNPLAATPGYEPPLSGPTTAWVNATRERCVDGPGAG